MRGAAVLAAGVVAALLAGCIRIPGISGGGPGGIDNDFGWKGPNGLGSGAVGAGVPLAQPKLDRALGDPATSGPGDWTPPFGSRANGGGIGGDGTAEVVSLGNDTNVYVFSTQTGRVLAKLPTTNAPGWVLQRVLNPVEAGVLRKGDPVSLVVADTAAYVAAWQFVPSQSSADHFTFNKTWERRLTECFREPSMDAKAVLADAGDGDQEVFLQTEEVGDYALKWDGTTAWKQCWGGGNSDPVVDDLDGDGHPEAIFAADDGFLSVFDAATGTPRWTFDTAKQLGVSPASISVAPAVADLDGHLPKEILFTARDAPRNGTIADYRNDHLALVAVHADASTGWQGRPLWWTQPSWANPLSYTHLVVRDVDGDGHPEVFGMDWNTIGHEPGNWERLGPAHAFRSSWDGHEVWHTEIDSWWSNKDILVGDLDGDGHEDVVANGPRGGGDGFWLLSAANGTAQAFMPAGGWKVLRAPQLADLHNDGRIEMVLPVEPVDGGDVRGAILLIALPRAAPNTGAA